MNNSIRHISTTAKFLYLLVFCFPSIIAYSATSPLQTTSTPPLLAFTDIVAGPNTGNTDTSLGQNAGQDGAIVTVWGTNLGPSPGTSTILVGGVPARIYSWGNATAPADLYSRHHMQMVVFQIPSTVSGATTIQAMVNGNASNTLPFTVVAGHIYFVKTTGNDATGDGSWINPWQTLESANGTGALTHMKAGDILYVGNGVQQTTPYGDENSAMDLDYNSANMATATQPKAIIAYPGATVTIGSTTVNAWNTWVDGYDTSSVYWTIAKINLIGNSQAASYNSGFRLIGNHVSAPLGDGETGAIEGIQSDNLYILGNEVTQTGYAGTSKLYHPMYIQSAENDNGPTRLPDEANREIAWNYLHDNYAYDGINFYREGQYSSYMTNTSVHDNYIINQTGRGMLIGEYLTGNQNYFYNNVIINAGIGPQSNYTSDPAFGFICVDFDAGAPGNPATTIYFYNNTLYGCGFAGSPGGSTGMIAVEHYYPFQLNFTDNVVESTAFPYIASGSTVDAQTTGTSNIWFGSGTAPSFDTASIMADPLFVNPAAGDMSLQSVSPAIDKAAVIPGITLTQDFIGIPRPQGPTNDIGAYEYNVSTPQIPVIVSFIASPTLTNGSNSSTLSWAVTGSSSLSIDQGVGDVTNVTSLSVHPTATTTYTLTATNASGSSTQTATITVDNVPPVLSTIMANSITTNAATISWTSNEPATSLVNYGLTSAYGQTIAEGILTPSHSVALTGLASNTLYHYQVQSMDDAGNQTVSSDFSFTTAAVNTQPPSVPSNLMATATSSSQINLTWAASTGNGALTYIIFKNGVQMGTSTSTTYASTGLAPATTYSYTVSAMDAAENTSAPSAPASATTPSIPPGTIALIQTSNSRTSLGANIYTVTMAPTTPGNLLVLGIHWPYAVKVSKITDNKGETWRLATLNKGYEGDHQGVWYVENNAGGVTSITVTFAGFEGQDDMMFAEYSGIAASNSLQSATFSQQNGSFQVSNFSSGNSKITAPGLLLGLTDSYYAGNYTWTNGKGFTQRTQTSDTNFMLQDNVVNTTGTYASSGSMSPQGAVDATLVAFKAMPASNTLSGAKKK